jgi:nicotinamide mononucleotide transporter
VKPKESIVTAILTVAASLLSATMVVLELSTWLEAASTITGALCVWLTVREKIWNFPIGLVNAATFFVVFWRAALYADATLQIFYFVLGIMGWYAWAYGGVNRSSLTVSRTPAKELVAVVTTTAVLTLGMWPLLRHWGDSSPLLDSLTTCFSLASQWLINRKRLESWIGWCLVDAVYVPLYVSRGLYLTALLYAVFFIMAAMGYRAWQLSWRRQSPGVVDRPLVGAVSR